MVSVSVRITAFFRFLPVITLAVFDSSLYLFHTNWHWSSSNLCLFATSQHTTQSNQLVRRTVAALWLEARMFSLLCVTLVCVHEFIRPHREVGVRRCLNVLFERVWLLVLCVCQQTRRSSVKPQRPINAAVCLRERRKGNLATWS